MKQRRKLPRRHLILYLPVLEQETGRPIGHLVDITTAGIGLATPHPVEPDSLLRLQVVLPQGIAGHERLDLEGRSVWCQRDCNPALYATGVELLQLPPQGAAVISSLVANYGFRD